MEAFQLIPSASFISSFVSGSIIAGAVTVGEGSKLEMRTKDEAAMIEVRAGQIPLLQEERKCWELLRIT